MRATMHKLHTALQPATPLHEDASISETGRRHAVSLGDRQGLRLVRGLLSTARRGSSRPGNSPGVEAPHPYASLEDDGDNIEVEVTRSRLDAGPRSAVEATPKESTRRRRRARPSPRKLCALIMMSSSSRTRRAPGARRSWWTPRP